MSAAVVTLAPALAPLQADVDSYLAYKRLRLLVSFAEQPDGSMRVEAIRVGPAKVKCPSCPYYEGCTDRCGWQSGEERMVDRVAADGHGTTLPGVRA